MTPERWQQVKAILAGAIECDDAHDRAGFVENSCAGDPLLRQLVEELLAYGEKPGAEPSPRGCGGAWLPGQDLE
jgi:hypothetical protein